MAADDEIVLPRLPRSLTSRTWSSLDDEDAVEDAEVRGDLAVVVAADVTIARSRLLGVRLAGAELPRLRLIDCLLETCDLSGAFLEASSWQRVELRDCRLSGTVLTGASLRHLRLDACRADAATLRMAKGEHLVARGSDLTGADLHAVQLSSARFEECTLTGVDLSQAKLADVHLRGCRLDHLSGALALAGVTIDAGMIVPVALLGLFGALGISVDDDDDETGAGRRR